MVTFTTGVFAAIAAVLGLLGVLVNPVALGVAVPFAIAAGLLWYHVSGRFHRDVRRRARAWRRRNRNASGGRHTAEQRSASEERVSLSDRQAYRALGLDPGASEDAVRRAYRERVKEVHPDRGGDEAEFQRVTAAYRQLTGE